MQPEFMEMTFPVVDPQQLYRQWQDGKLLDNDERNALRAHEASEAGKPRFADLLKSATERDN
jgi:hypothetical protein